MKRAVFLTATFLICLPTLRAESPPVGPLLLIPQVLTAPQQSSPRMTALIARIASESLPAQLKRAESIPLLPEWVHQEKETEVFFITAHPLFIHGSRYAIILRSDGSALVVRAGGLSDGYDYFALPKSV